MAAAQFGIFATLLGAVALNWVPGIEFTIQQAAAIAIIGGADGPTAIYLASQLAPELLGAIAVAAYSYMALVPVLQPPVMRLLTTKKRTTNSHDSAQAGVKEGEDPFSIDGLSDDALAAANRSTVSGDVLSW